MKKTLTALTILGGIFAVSDANALIFDPYIGGGIQIGEAKAYFDKDLSLDKTKPSYSAFLGVNLPIVRAEVEYNYFQVDEKNQSDSDLSLHNVMANAYVKPFAIPFVKPYIGAGIGTILSGDAPRGVDINNSGAVQGMLGLSLDLPAMPLGVDIEYRATYGFDVIEENNEDADLLIHGVRAKVRYKF